MLRIVAVLLGIGMIGLGLLGVAFGIVEILDPGTSKPADDNDPFGPPLSFWESTFVTLLYLAVAVVGGIIIRRLCSAR